MMWITIVLLIYLIILGIADGRKREVSALWLTVGSILATCVGIYRCAGGDLSWLEMLAGIVPGMLLLLVAWGTRKAGYADGIVLMQIGMSLGCRKVLLLFGCSMFFLAVVSIVMLVMGRVKKETKMPYLTFLAITFGMLELWG